MVGPIKEWYRRSRTVAPTVALAGAVLLLSLSGLSLHSEPPPVVGEPARGVADGLFVSVPNPITTTAAQRVMTKVERFLQRPDHRGLKIVFDFNRDDFPACTTDYGPCRTLAQFILERHDVTTIAFVHQEVSGHTVLPVLACKEIVMSKGGQPGRDQTFSSAGVFGDVLREQTRPLEPDQVVFYGLVAERTGRCPALVHKMADRKMEVLEGTRRGAAWYIDNRRRDEEVRQGFHPGERIVVEAGAPGLYRAEQGRRFGLVGLIRETRQEVAEAYSLPPRSLREDPLEGRAPVAVRVEVKGPINAALRETLKRRIQQAIGRRGANFIVLQLECGGGDAAEARELAEYLRSLEDDQGAGRVMTVAYVTVHARDIALYLALGCTEIVMDSRAHLGDFEQMLKTHPRAREPLRESLASLAEMQGYPPILFRGMFDPELEIHRVRSRQGTLERRFIDGEAFRQDAQTVKHWEEEGQLKASVPSFASGNWFKLEAESARDLEISRATFEGEPSEALPKIAAFYGIEGLPLAGTDWLDELARFLNSPVVGTILIMIGITGLILELKLPGVGFPGVLAAICFVLYFWAHSQLSGHLTMLAVLLFVLGLILIGLEIFVVPGFGVTGVSGIVLVVLSLALATLVKKPETSKEWVDFGMTLSQIALSLLAAVGAAFVLAWYLPHLPYVNRLVLKPPTSDAADAGVDEASLAAAAMLGVVGEAATPLRPAGKVRLGDELVDVIAEGYYVQPGTRVQVIEIEGNRIVVKPL